jgi:hypothetical protein
MIIGRRERECIESALCGSGVRSTRERRLEGYAVSMA